MFLDVRSPSIHQLGQHVWWHVRDLGRWERLLRMVLASVYGASEHASECKHGDMRLAVKEHVSKAMPPPPKCEESQRLRCSLHDAHSNWSGKRMQNVLSILLDLDKREQQTWAAAQIFPKSCAQAEAAASEARSSKRQRLAAMPVATGTYAAGAAGLPVDMTHDTPGELLRLRVFYPGDRVDTPDGAGCVDEAKDDGTYTVVLDEDAQVCSHDALSLRLEVAHLAAAAEDSEDEDRRAARRARLTMDKSSVVERAQGAASASSETCSLTRWSVGDTQERASNADIGIGADAVLKVSYATNSVIVQGTDAGADGRLRKVTVPVHKWALEDGELQVHAARPPFFRSSVTQGLPPAGKRTKWSTVDSADMSVHGAASTFRVWRLALTAGAKLKKLESLKGNAATLPAISGQFDDSVDPRDRGLGAQIGIPRVRTHSVESHEFLVKAHRAQEGALQRAAAMTPTDLAAEGAEHQVVDQLLEELCEHRQAFFTRVEATRARVMSSKGSRGGGQDSDSDHSNHSHADSGGEDAE